MPELGSYGSVRGAAGNSRPYRDCRHDELSTRCGGRRPKSAKARNRGKRAPAVPRAFMEI
jgi:hypothetical protein